MKKLLILIVSVAIFLHFFPQAKLTAWYQTQKQQVLDFFSEATDTRVRLKTSKIYDQLSQGQHRFSPKELAAIKTLSQDRRSVNSFNNSYCQGDKSHPVFHRANLAKVCAKINEFSNLL